MTSSSPSLALVRIASVRRDFSPDHTGRRRKDCTTYKARVCLLLAKPSDHTPVIQLGYIFEEWQKMATIFHGVVRNGIDEQYTRVLDKKYRSFCTAESIISSVAYLLGSLTNVQYPAKTQLANMATAINQSWRTRFMGRGGPFIPCLYVYDIAPLCLQAPRAGQLAQKAIAVCIKSGGNIEPAITYIDIAE